MANFLKGLRRSDRRDVLPPVGNVSSSQQPSVPSSSGTARSSSLAAVAPPEVVREKVGLYELSDNDGGKTVDVVAIHGLQGDAYKTWEHDNGSLWLRDFLPAEIPSARIMTFGYDSTVAFSQSVAKLEDKALELLNRLSIKRNIAGHSSARPIVFVCHSLGGLLVKNALILAHERTGDVHYKDILDNTKAIAFLGVPHSGSNNAWWASIAANALKAASIGLVTNTALVKDLEKDSEALVTISKQFVERSKGLVIYTFYETRKISGVLVVDKLSARIGLPNEKLFPVDANHRTICQFSAADSQAYEGVGPWIVELVRNVSIERPTPEARLATIHLNEGRSQSYYEVPNRRIRCLIGREDIMTRIDYALTAGSEPNIARSGPRIAVLQGMGGQGKSQVALHYCDKKKKNPFSAIFWVDAMTESSVKRCFHSISECIKTSADHLPDSNARVSFVLRTFSAWSFQWLMVFDNYDNPGAFPIQDFIPQDGIGAILVTSRHAGTSGLVLEHRSSFIELPGLEEKAALRLLFLHSQKEEASSTIASVGEDIVRKLGYHPLAITQAGSYIRKRTRPFHEFLNDYERRKEFILKNTPQLSQYRRKLGEDDKETSLNVFTTWELSFEQLQQQSSMDGTETKLLTLFAFFDNKDISEMFFAQHERTKSMQTFELLAWLTDFTDDNHKWDGQLFRDVLVHFRDLSLLQTFTEESDGFCYWSMHPLIKDWIRVRTDRSTCQKNSVIAAVLISSVLKNAYDVRNRKFKLPLSTRQTLTTHIIAQNENYKENLSSLPGLHHDYLEALFWSTCFIVSMGFYEHAVLTAEIAVKRYTEKFGLEDKRTLPSIDILGCVYLRQKRLDEAQKLFTHLLESSKRVLGPEHINTLNSMFKLAATYVEQGRLEQGEKLLVQTIETAKSKWGLEHWITLNSMGNLSVTYALQGRLDEAEELMSSVLKTSLRTMGPEKYDKAVYMHDLACIYREQGRESEAIELMRKVVGLRTKLEGPSHPRTLKAVKILNRWLAT